MPRNTWFTLLDRWLHSDREQAELRAMTERERRDARVSEYDIRWR